MLMEEGLEKISAYTELWIKKVFIDFLNLSMYSLSDQMINVKNEGFKKLIKKEINSQNEEYINLVNCLTDLHLQISEIKNVCYTFQGNENIKLGCFEKYFECLRNYTNFMCLKMFRYGVQFGLELKKDNSSDNFKW